MVLALNKVHEYSKVNDGGPPVLTRMDPVVRLGCREPDKDPIYVFIQHGVFYTEDTKVIKTADLPHWLDKEIGKMSVKAREECGLHNWTNLKTWLSKNSGQVEEGE